MGQTARTTKLLLNLSERGSGGANRDKRRYLEETVTVLDAARRFYLVFSLAYPQKLMEQVEVISKQAGEVSKRLISADKLLTWAEFHTVETDAHLAGGKEAVAIGQAGQRGTQQSAALATYPPSEYGCGA